LIVCGSLSIIDGLNDSIGQGTDGIKLSDAVGYLKIYSFKVSYGLAKGLPFVGIASGQYENSPRDTLSATEDPLRHHQLIEYFCPFVLSAQKIFLGHRHIAEDQSACACTEAAHPKIAIKIP
jgi:hypothetical protein